MEEPARSAGLPPAAAGPKGSPDPPAHRERPHKQCRRATARRPGRGRCGGIPPHEGAAGDRNGLALRGKLSPPEQKASRIVHPGARARRSSRQSPAPCRHGWFCSGLHPGTGLAAKLADDFYGLGEQAIPWSGGRSINDHRARRPKHHPSLVATSRSMDCSLAGSSAAAMAGHAARTDALFVQSAMFSSPARRDARTAHPERIGARRQAFDARDVNAHDQWRHFDRCRCRDQTASHALKSELGAVRCRYFCSNCAKKCCERQHDNAYRRTLDPGSGDCL